MATIVFEVPDAFVPELVAALALRAGVPVPATAAEKVQLAEDFIHDRLVEVFLDYKGQRAAQQARTNADDPGVVWATPRLVRPVSETVTEAQPEPTISASPRRTSGT